MTLGEQVGCEAGGVGAVAAEQPAQVGVEEPAREGGRVFPNSHGECGSPSSSVKASVLLIRSGSGVYSFLRAWTARTPKPNYLNCGFPPFGADRWE